MIESKTERGKIMIDDVKPFVKWAGGKGSLINQLTKYYPQGLLNGEIDTYVEPFVGGGAVLINILKRYKIKNAYAFDINKDLINCYKVIQENVEELISQLQSMQEKYISYNAEERSKYYYAIRDEYNSDSLNEQISVKRASEFIFLNRTCFNGLYRVNKDGKFNVPSGKYKNPTICDEENLRNLSQLIKDVKFIYGDYTKSEGYINDKTFVYFDPPYRPLNISSGFTSYTKEDFDDNDQKELASYYGKLHQKNVNLMLSNSNPKNTNKEDNFFEEIYKGFNINEVFAKRMINANASGRGEISELLITNYNNN